MYGFVAQLNEGRYSKKRPTEFRVDQVVQPFDSAKFNFTKAFKREVLFAFEPAPAGHDSSFEDAGRCNASPNVVLINVRYEERCTCANSRHDLEQVCFQAWSGNGEASCMHTYHQLYCSAHACLQYRFLTYVFDPSCLQSH